MSEIERHVYAVWGVPPETQAYAMAKYSRSSQSMLESIAELSEERTAKFLETFYFAYGHRSIADLAHVAISFENCSLLAAMHIVDEPLWDGQERSTRYQDFRKTGYFIPTSIAGTEDEAAFRATADHQFAEYVELTRELTSVLMDVVPRPDGTGTDGRPEMDPRTYERTLRARAFDVTRYLLPLATRTSVGQITSARVVEQQIVRLLSDGLPECRAIAEELRDACTKSAHAPILAKAIEVAANPLLEHLVEIPAVPTLVKYTVASPFHETAGSAIARCAARLLQDVPVVAAGSDVRLVNAIDPEVDLIASLLYRFDPGSHSFAEVVACVGSLGREDRDAVIAASLEGRGRFDDLLREHRAGYGLTFEITMDVGGFRDMHRHRRCVQIIRDLDPRDGFDDPAEVFLAGLGERGAALATERGLVARFRATLNQSFEAADKLRPRHGVDALYLLPLAVRQRALFKMDIAQAAYIAELRTGVGGHFSYRRTAWHMREALLSRYPSLANALRATNPYEEVDLLRR